MTEKQKYHEIFVPQPDIYTLSGNDAFMHLARKSSADQRNLLVFPLAFLEQLGKYKANLIGGAEEAMEHLSRLTKERDTLVQAGIDGLPIFRTLPGLDVAIADKSFIPDDETFSNTELVKKLQANFVLLPGEERDEEQKKPRIVTNQHNLHIKYSARGMSVQYPDFLIVSEGILDEGMVTGNEELMAMLMSKPHDKQEIRLEEAVKVLERELRLNQQIKFMGEQPQYARVVGDLVWNSDRTRITDVKNLRVAMLHQREYGKHIHVGQHPMDTVLGIAPRDMEQYLAMQYGFFDPNISVFFLAGNQGSGKTLITYASVVDQVLWYDQELRVKRGLPADEKGARYKQIVLIKANEVLGGSRRNLGFMPGDLWEKMQSYLESYEDAHDETILANHLQLSDMVLHPKFPNHFGKIRPNVEKIGGHAHLNPKEPVITMTYSGFMRGRSFKDTIMIIDEAQNFTPYEIKTMIERMGEGSKVIISGDPAQFDNPMCTRQINGLTAAVKQYIGRPYVHMVKLFGNYRSQASDDARRWKVFSA